MPRNFGREILLMWSGSKIYVVGREDQRCQVTKVAYNNHGVKAFIGREVEHLGIVLHDMVMDECYETRLAMTVDFCKLFSFHVPEYLYLDDTKAFETIALWKRRLENPAPNLPRMNGILMYKRKSGNTFRPRMWLLEKLMCVDKRRVKQWGDVDPKSITTQCVLVDVFFRFRSISYRIMPYGDDYIEDVISNAVSFYDLEKFFNYPYSMDDTTTLDLTSLFPTLSINNADEDKVCKLIESYPCPLSWPGASAENLIRAYRLRHARVRLDLSKGFDYLSKLLIGVVTKLPKPYHGTDFEWPPTKRMKPPFFDSIVTS